MLNYKDMARLDKLIHEPARLAIMNALDTCSLLEFLFLQELTGLTKGNLSSHLSKLERNNYIKIDKQFVRRKIPNTTITITNDGRASLEKYWNQLEKILKLRNDYKEKNN